MLWNQLGQSGKGPQSSLTSAQELAVQQTSEEERITDAPLISDPETAVEPGAAGPTTHYVPESSSGSASRTTTPKIRAKFQRKAKLLIQKLKQRGVQETQEGELSANEKVWHNSNFQALVISVLYGNSTMKKIPYQTNFIGLLHKLDLAKYIVRKQYPKDTFGVYYLKTASVRNPQNVCN